ncbi:methylated-DNA--[protein]-cysteine S-methyltransferase [Parahaliea sp. F7430]|uniref:Methylated-DNA--[protein]-cysteine S-methyltransferase n=1 Tax=Sediminihaliea albiluteola TaxID=2758564 RepID=A0A7W2TYG7_9GAMM|nr:methylated-DNA--[protein]-cysteine S-methyltransferase [Sediminihaliea albiluteola]MBA6414293.1 methylated-DNA--[protein]-cysteine S-methyltransferase [Sediminihaliea albiluteola]
MSEYEPSLDQRVWQVVAMIPSGKVATYGDIARQAGLPAGARRVGHALRQLPADSKIPWHRVINAQGKLSLAQGSAGYYTQRERLTAEGLVLNKDKIVDFSQCRWNP